MVGTTWHLIQKINLTQKGKNLNNLVNKNHLECFKNKLIFFALRFNLLKTSDKRIDQDGVNSLKYDVTSIIKNKLFTKIIVNYDQSEIQKNKTANTTVTS